MPDKLSQFIINFAAIQILHIPTGHCAIIETKYLDNLWSMDQVIERVCQIGPCPVPIRNGPCKDCPWFRWNEATEVEYEITGRGYL